MDFASSNSKKTIRFTKKWHKTNSTILVTYMIHTKLIFDIETGNPNKPGGHFYPRFGKFLISQKRYMLRTPSLRTFNKFLFERYLKTF